MLVIVLLLTGCTFPSRQTDPTQEALTDVAASPGTFRPTPTPRAILEVQPTPQPGALIIWTNEHGQALDAVRDIANLFSEQSGLLLTIVPKSGDGLRVGMLVADLAQEPPPDLLWGNQEDLAGLLADGQLQSLNPVGGTSRFIPATIVNATQDNQLWGQPIAAGDFLLLLYNQSLIQRPPATTDELIVQARAARGDETYGLTMPWAEARWLLAWLNGYGGAPTTPDGRQPTLNTPQMVSALNLLLELHIAAPPDQLSYTGSQMYFGAGESALTIDGDWALADYQGLTETHTLGIAPLPRVPATGRWAAPALGGAYLMFPQTLTGAKHEQASVFAQFLAEPAQQIRIARQFKRLPVLQSVLSESVVQGNPALAAIAAQANLALGLPPTQGFRCAIRAINNNLPSLLDDTLDQEAAAEAMQQQAEQCVTQ
ncbi:MAG: extracellular solute-binding protein [Chloroflexales bacterium]|nr:extracellular solute-binding protein [Chloroflexales bacterium]